MIVSLEKLVGDDKVVHTTTSELTRIELGGGETIVRQRVNESGTYVHCHAETGYLGLLREDKAPARLKRGMYVWTLTTHVLEKISKRTGHTLWTTADGEKVLVRRMAQSHLENTWHMLERELVALEADYKKFDGAGRLAAPRGQSHQALIRRKALWIAALAREMVRRG